MSKSSVEQCRTGKDFAEYARNHPDLVDYRTGHGSHAIVKGPLGRGIVPVHPHELTKHQQRKLVRMFKAIGLAAVVIGIPVIALHLWVLL